MEVVRLNGERVRLTGAQLQLRCPLVAVVEGLDKHGPLAVEAASVHRQTDCTGCLVDAQKFVNGVRQGLRVFGQRQNGSNGVANASVWGGLVVDVRGLNGADCGVLERSV